MTFATPTDSQETAKRIENFFTVNNVKMKVIGMECGLDLFHGISLLLLVGSIIARKSGKSYSHGVFSVAEMENYAGSLRCFRMV